MKIIKNYKVYAIPFLLCSVVSMGFILAATIKFRMGFPLDDAWIHQTFARNLASYGEWSFNPGSPSAGSTSPLWTLLISIGYFAHIPALVWAYILGISLFVLLAILIVSLASHEGKRSNKYFMYLTIFLAATEWHLVWAAVSGMETILFSLAMIAVFWLLIQKKLQPILIGTVIGLSMWVRPEGLTLLGPGMLVIFVKYYSRKIDVLKVSLRLLLPLILITTPYLFFNYSLSGHIWPNTLIAKQIEYQGFSNINILLRYGKLLFTPLIGSNLLLLPGFINCLHESVRSKNVTKLAFITWTLGFLLIYAVKLPVTYQHGRYLVPIIPIYLSLAIPGMMRLLEKIQLEKTGWVIGRVWIISTILVSIGFTILGARAYASDVAVIESEMVETSKWIDQNTSENSVIAAHDIGALGYFGNRKVVDLAGLINPEVVNIVTNSIALRKYIDDSEINFLMTFPFWYMPPLFEESHSIYISPFTYSIEEGGERMEVYKIDK